MSGPHDAVNGLNSGPHSGLSESELDQLADATGADLGRSLLAKSYKEFEAWCRDHGHRITARRRTVAEIVLAARDYPNVVELYSRARAANSQICLATVYRTLRLLAEFGTVRRYTFRGGRPRYGPALAGREDHLIDIASGTVIEFRCDEIERLQKAVARSLGYRLTGYTLELYGEPIRAPKRRRSPIGGTRSD